MVWCSLCGPGLRREGKTAKNTRLPSCESKRCSTWIRLNRWLSLCAAQTLVSAKHFWMTFPDAVKSVTVRAFLSSVQLCKYAYADDGKNASTCDSTHCITYSFVDLERFLKVLSRVCIPFQHPILSFGMSQFTLFRRYCNAIVLSMEPQKRIQSSFFQLAVFIFRFHSMFHV